MPQETWLPAVRVFEVHQCLLKKALEIYFSDAFFVELVFIIYYQITSSWGALVEDYQLPCRDKIASFKRVKVDAA